MKKFFTLFAISLVILGNVFSQTIKSLGYNTSNNHVITAGNSLVWTNGLVVQSPLEVFGSGDTVLLSPAKLEFISFGDIFNSEENTFIADDIQIFYWASSSNQQSSAFVVNTPQFWDWPAQTRTNLGIGATWLTNTNAANFRSDIGLGDNQRSAIFPSETSVKKVRYFNNQLVNSAPVNTALKTNVVTILPFYLPKRTTNLSAVSVPRLMGTTSPVYCAVYSASNGYRNATLVETKTVTNSTVGGIADNVYVNFTNTFEQGWYILSGRVDVTTLTNSGNYSLVNANDPAATLGIEPVIYNGVKGTYNSGHTVVASTNFPTSFTNLSQEIATSALLYWFPYY